jgi:hypothetical protein
MVAMKKAPKHDFQKKVIFPSLYLGHDCFSLHRIGNTTEGEDPFGLT